MWNHNKTYMASFHHIVPLDSTKMNITPLEKLYMVLQWSIVLHSQTDIFSICGPYKRKNNGLAMWE